MTRETLEKGNNLDLSIEELSALSQSIDDAGTKYEKSMILIRLSDELLYKKIKAEFKAIVDKHHQSISKQFNALK